MKNKEILEALELYYTNIDTVSYVDFKIVCTFLVHSYLFYNPLKNLNDFMDEFIELIPNSIGEAIKDFFSSQRIYNLNGPICHSARKAALDIIAKTFDVNHFKEQSARLDYEEEENSEALIDKYIYLLNEKKLVEFANIALNSSSVFCSDIDSIEVEAEINDYCRKINSSIPYYYDPITLWDFIEVPDDFGDYDEFIKENPLYMFDYMKREDVAKIYRASIKDNLILAGNIAKILYYCDDIRLARLCIAIACNFKECLGIDINTCIEHGGLCYGPVAF